MTQSLECTSKPLLASGMQGPPFSGFLRQQEADCFCKLMGIKRKCGLEQCLGR